MEGSKILIKGTFEESLIIAKDSKMHLASFEAMYKYKPTSNGKKFGHSQYRLVDFSSFKLDISDEVVIDSENECAALRFTGYGGFCYEHERIWFIVSLKRYDESSFEARCIYYDNYIIPTYLHINNLKLEFRKTQYTNTYPKSWVDCVCL
jgi:hypothetical protein